MAWSHCAAAWLTKRRWVWQPATLAKAKASISTRLARSARPWKTATGAAATTSGLLPSPRSRDHSGSAAASARNSPAGERSPVQRAPATPATPVRPCRPVGPRRGDATRPSVSFRHARSRRARACMLSKTLPRDVQCLPGGGALLGLTSEALKAALSPVPAMEVVRCQVAPRLLCARRAVATLPRGSATCCTPGCGQPLAALPGRAAVPKPTRAISVAAALLLA